MRTTRINDTFIYFDINSYICEQNETGTIVSYIIDHSFQLPNSNLKDAVDLSPKDIVLLYPNSISNTSEPYIVKNTRFQDGKLMITLEKHLESNPVGFKI